MLADDIADFLTSGGIAASMLFVGDFPAQPHTALVVTPTGGEGPTRTMSGTPSHAPLETVRFQLRARATGYTLAEALINSAHVLASGVSERAINSRRYYYIRPVQSPQYLGFDELNRSLFACNYSVQRAESTA
jgi:hypothetical protein